MPGEKLPQENNCYNQGIFFKKIILIFTQEHAFQKVITMSNIRLFQPLDNPVLNLIPDNSYGF